MYSIPTKFVESKVKFKHHVILFCRKLVKIVCKEEEFVVTCQTEMPE